MYKTPFWTCVIPYMVVTIATTDCNIIRTFVPLGLSTTLCQHSKGVMSYCYFRGILTAMNIDGNFVYRLQLCTILTLYFQYSYSATLANVLQIASFTLSTSLWSTPWRPTEKNPCLVALLYLHVCTSTNIAFYIPVFNFAQDKNSLHNYTLKCKFICTILIIIIRSAPFLICLKAL